MAVWRVVADNPEPCWESEVPCYQDDIDGGSPEPHDAHLFGIMSTSEHILGPGYHLDCHCPGKGEE